MQIIAVVITAIVLLFTVGVVILRTYTDPWHEKIADAGFVEKNIRIGTTNVNYAEGPDNGPALLLLHAQHMDWFSYSRVLPELSETFHVFAVSYHGHGKTTSVAENMNANQIGSDLAQFIETIVGEPVYATGNSSGGLLTAWLAANRPDLINAIVLEDPPFFNSEYPKVQQTIAYKSFTTCHNYVEAGAGDFLLYWLDSSAPFIQKQAGKGALPVMKAVVALTRGDDADKAIEMPFVPDALSLMLRGLSMYDPHFGAAFYDGSWQEGFDHAEALQRIECPALLLHANFECTQEGLLNGGLDQEEADEVIRLIPNAEYRKVDAGHVVHLEQPELFAGILKNFFLKQD